LYLGDNDLSWTLIKAIQLIIKQDTWSPYDDPTSEEKYRIGDKLKQFLTTVKLNLEEDFKQWSTNHFDLEKKIFLKDFLTIIHDTSIAIDKFIVDP
jgi:hypothetical protein